MRYLAAIVIVIQEQYQRMIRGSIQMRSNTLKGIKDDGDMSFIKG